MAIETTCSGCGKKLSVPDEHAGKQARCPVCGQIYAIPIPPASSGPTTAGQAPVDSGQGTFSTPAQNQPTNWQDRGAASTDSLYWMEASDGKVYGPVDRAGLDRWFSEGRVGPGYRIRQGEYGLWAGADEFRPKETTTVNPYAPSASGMGGTGLFAYPKADNGVLILAMGILGFIVCPIFSVIAWIMGAGALRDIQSGQMDPKNKGLVQAGYYLGIINCCLQVLCFCAYFVIIAITVVAQ